jgi:hypothetical protein
MTESDRVNVTVLLNVGEESEILTPRRDLDNPLRVPAAAIASDTGIPARKLPGKRLTAIVDEQAGTARDFRA